MPRAVSSVGKLSVIKHAVTPENTPEYIARIAEKVDLLVDTLSIAPEDNLQVGSANSETIQEEVISKKHSVAADSANLLDNPTFETGELKSFYARVRGGDNYTWERYKPTDAPLPYQGNYVCRYIIKGQTTTATLKGSVSNENVSKYAPGVIPAQQGEKYTFSFQALFTADTPSSLTNLSATLEFVDKSGSVLATHTSTDNFSSTSINTWKEFKVEDKTAPANTSYVVAGVKLNAPSSTTEDTVYYIDGMNLRKILWPSASKGPVYGSFSKGWGTASLVTHTGVVQNTINWFGVPTSWVSNTASDISELTATGRFSPASTIFPSGGTRTFLVNASINLWYYSTASYLGLAARITKTSGGSTAEVAGSAQTTSWDHYLIYLGSYFYMKSLATSAIVTLSDGDTIQFQYGVNSVNAGSNVSVVAYRTYESGLTINMTAID